MRMLFRLCVYTPEVSILRNFWYTQSKARLWQELALADYRDVYFMARSFFAVTLQSRRLGVYDKYTG